MALTRCTKPFSRWAHSLPWMIRGMRSEGISAEIVDAGYDVVKIETVLKSIAEIKAELKSRK